MQRDVDSLCEWADKWQMEFNVRKCKTMHLGPKNSRHKYEMKGHILESVLIERDLGVSVSSDMKVLEQCNQARKKANRMLGWTTKKNYIKQGATVAGELVQDTCPSSP